MRAESGVSLVSGALQSSLARAQKNYKFHGSNSSYNSDEKKQIRKDKSVNKQLSAYCETIGSKFASYSCDQLLELSNDLEFESGGKLKQSVTGDLENSFIVLEQEDPNKAKLRKKSTDIKKKKKVSSCDKASPEKASPIAISAIPDSEVLVQKSLSKAVVNVSVADEEESEKNKTVIAKFDNPIKKLINQLKDKAIKKNKRKRLIKKLKKLQLLRQELGTSEVNGDSSITSNGDIGVVETDSNTGLNSKFKDPRHNKLSALANTLASISTKKTTDLTKSLTIKTKKSKMGPESEKNGTISASNGSAANNGIQLPEPKRILYPKEKILLGWRQKRGPGAGFHNFGNTCYLNSSLQAMLHVPAFVNWLQNDDEHRKMCNGILPNQTPCIICVMYVTLQDHTKNSSCAIRPRVLDKLKVICKHFGYGRQEDAHEFLRYLLEGMERSYLTLINGLRLDNRTKETNPLGQIFGGYIRTEVTCQQCNFVSTTFQPSAELQLDIRHTTTLEDALQQHFRRERLDNNDYKCEKCRTLSQATKQFSLEIPPLVLCLQLKRFTLYGNKISKRIHCNKYLNMSKYLHKSRKSSPSYQEKDLKYRLVALVTHIGQSPNCGHYTAIAEGCNGNYYQFDDQQVYQVSAQNALNNDAYVIIYEMVGNSQLTASDMSIGLSASNYAANHSPALKPSVTSSGALTNGCSPTPKKPFAIPFSKSASNGSALRNAVMSNTDATNKSSNGTNGNNKLISFGIQNPMKPSTPSNKINILKPGVALTNSPSKPAHLSLSTAINGVKNSPIKLVPYNDVENGESDKEDQGGIEKEVSSAINGTKEKQGVKLIGPVMEHSSKELTTPLKNSRPMSSTLPSSSPSNGRTSSPEKTFGIKRKLEDFLEADTTVAAGCIKKKENSIPDKTTLNATSEWKISSSTSTNGYSSDPDKKLKSGGKVKLSNRAKSMERERSSVSSDKRISLSAGSDRPIIAAIIPNNSKHQLAASQSSSKASMLSKGSVAYAPDSVIIKNSVNGNGHNLVKTPVVEKRKRSRSRSSSPSSDEGRKRKKKNMKKKKKLKKDVKEKDKSKSRKRSSSSSSCDSDKSDHRHSKRSSKYSKSKNQPKHRNESGENSSTSGDRKDSDRSIDRETDSAERDRILRQARNPSRSPASRSESHMNGNDSRSSSSNSNEKFNPNKMAQRDSSIIAWNGNSSVLSKSIEDQRKQLPTAELYDEDFDQGRTKKIKEAKSPTIDKDGTNQFQSYQDKQTLVKSWSTVLDGYGPGFKDHHKSPNSSKTSWGKRSNREDPRSPPSSQSSPSKFDRKFDKGGNRKPYSGHRFQNNNRSGYKNGNGHRSYSHYDKPKNWNKHRNYR